MLNRILAVGLVGALVAAFFGAGGLAVFTDTASVGGNTFTTGTVDISTAPTSAIVSFSNMAPGDTVTDDVVVTNGGSLQLRYSLSASATSSTPELKDQLVLTVKTLGTSCALFDGTQLYSGDLDDTDGVLFGNPASTGAGAGTGDRILNAAASETLCFQVNLPLATGDTYQNKTTTATFTFNAEQTANN